ncbi:MAG: sugar phosphate isomerase/epimerase, partial [bacterium]|nr:sugar phosphate isomerase/epimerase [bacterium]
MSKKTSIGAWAYIWGGYEEEPIPLTTVVKKLSELGFDGIEFAAFPPHLEPNTKEKRQEIKKLFDDHGLEVSGVAAPFPSPATATKDEYLEAVKGNLDVCADLNIPKLRVDTISPPTEIPGGMDYETCFSKVADAWNSAAEVCQKQGVKLIWEFEPGFLFNKPSEVVRMVYKVDHPNFSVLFDSCHAYMCAVIGARQLGEKETLPGGVVQFAHMLSGKIGHIHLIDSDGTLHGDETSTHAPLGTGILDFSTIMPAIKEAGYDDEWWPIDLCFWADALE